MFCASPLLNPFWGVKLKYTDTCMHRHARAYTHTRVVDFRKITNFWILATGKKLSYRSEVK